MPSCIVPGRMTACRPYYVKAVRHPSSRSLPCRNVMRRCICLATPQHSQQGNDMTDHDLAQRIVHARRQHRAIGTLPLDSLPPDAATAYAIQQAVIAGLGGETGAWKIGAKAPGGPTSGAPIPAALTVASPARLEHGAFFRVLLELEVAFRFARSEEHTSELQSRRDLVCRLLLEKKKKRKE